MDWLPSLAESPGVRRRRRGVAMVVVAALLAAGLVAAFATVRAMTRPVGGVTVREAAPTGATVYRVPRELTAIAAQVADVRGLPLQRPIAARVTDPATFADDVQRLALGPDERHARAQHERMAKALGLVPADVDLEAMLVEVYREQAIGLYAPEDQMLHVGSPDGEISTTVAWAIAHEAAHALQDQTFGLDALLDVPPAEADRLQALLALVEGDAVITQEVWSRRFQTTVERSALSPITGDPTVTAAGVVPPYVREGFTFPYEAGAEFAAAILDREGFSALDDVYRSPPVSTEQILHPEKYRAGETPIAVSTPADPGPGWEAELDQTFGEAHLRQLLNVLGDRRAARLAEGWGGARLRTWVRGDDVAVSLVAVMDTRADAGELCAAIPGWWEVARAPGVMAHHCDGRDITVGVAPDDDVADTLASTTQGP